jgi:UDP-glucose 4-epimerase
MKLRSALVTGGTGFIGSALVRRLVADSTEVVCIARPNTPPERLARLAGATVIHSSYEPHALLRTLAEVTVDTVFNLASYGVHQDERDTESMIDGNIGVLTHVLELAAHNGVKRFIHAGSCSQYATPPGNELVAEDAPLRPTSLYGAAKTAAELYGTALANRLHVPFVALRVFGVYGPGETPERLVPAIISHLERGDEVDLTPGEQVRDLSYVDDVVDAFIAAATADAIRDNGAYNVCTSQGVSIRAVGETAARLMQKPQRLLGWGRRPYRADEPMWLVGDNRALRAATGWSPRVTLEEGIQKMLTARATVPCGELAQ